MSPTRRIVVGAIATAMLSGCAIGAQPEPTPSPEQPFALAISDEAVIEALGPVPADEETSPERLAAFRETEADRAWRGISSLYPDAVRATAEPTYLPAAEAAAARKTCLAEQGLELPEGGTDDQALVKASTLAAYACQQRFADERGPGLSERQVAYLYDYQTKFVLPCYAEKGHTVTRPPITRDEYIAQWPFQNWTPEPSDIDVMTIEYDQLNLMCPGVPDEWN
jgi:hypothetical protein